MIRFLLLLLLTTSLAADDQKRDPMIEQYLKSVSSAQGGYRPYDPNPAEILIQPTLSATSSGVRAENYLFGEIARRKDHAAFVRSCFAEGEGGFSQTPKGKVDVASTAIGLMAAAELGIDSKELISKSVEYLVKNAKTFEERRIAAAGFEAVKQFPEVTKEWIVELRKTANPDGSYGEGPTKGRSTGGAIAFILRLNGELSPEERKAAVSTLQSAQQADGAFIGADGKTTDLEATYRIMRAFYLLKEKPKDLKKLNEYLLSCQSEDGGFGPKPATKGSGNRFGEDGDSNYRVASKSTVSATYYYASISKWIKAMESWK
jgi:prenyltransferase beta subunit